MSIPEERLSLPYVSSVGVAGMVDHDFLEHPSTVSRRRVLGSALAVAGGLAVSSAAGVASATQGRIVLTMPAPTGPHSIGTVSLHLVDHARQDPWLTRPHPRELMVS